MQRADRLSGSAHAARFVPSTSRICHASCSCGALSYCTISSCVDVSAVIYSSTVFISLNASTGSFPIDLEHLCDNNLETDAQSISQCCSYGGIGCGYG